MNDRRVLLVDKKPYDIDVAVLLIFFCRDYTFKYVFEQVKKARPSKLYLYQDGPRLGRNDAEGIQKCREIAADIDWDCEVHQFYQEKNIGCDPSEYIAQKWMFDTEEMGIVLEDDVVPSPSFFPYCLELLERYKDDERINIICGMNNTYESDHVETSYFFTKGGAISGWASWKRVLDTWEGDYAALDDENVRKRIILDKSPRWLKTVLKRKKEGCACYEHILSLSQTVNHRINIVPKYTLTTNIGLTADSTHKQVRKLMTKKEQRFFGQTPHEMAFPMKHPIYVYRDVTFEQQRKKSLTDRVEKFFRLLFFDPCYFFKRCVSEIAYFLKR